MGQKLSLRGGCNENAPKKSIRKHSATPDTLQRHLVREQHRNVHEVYDVAGIIGEGSISTIYKIVKKKRKSSSVNLVRRRSSLFRRSHKLVERRRSTISGQEYALKEIGTSFVKEGLVDELRNEIELLKDLDHPNIVRVRVSLFFVGVQSGNEPVCPSHHPDCLSNKAYETYYYREKLSLVIELCAGGDLYVRNPYTEVQSASVTKQILSAVNYMHKHNVIHRDCKY